VHSHIGVHGNEQADKLAFQATIHQTFAQYQYTRSDINAYIKRTLKKMDNDPRK